LASGPKRPPSSTAGPQRSRTRGAGRPPHERGRLRRPSRAAPRGAQHRQDDGEDCPICEETTTSRSPTSSAPLPPGGRCRHQDRAQPAPAPGGARALLRRRGVPAVRLAPPHPQVPAGGRTRGPSGPGSPPREHPVTVVDVRAAKRSKGAAPLVMVTAYDTRARASSTPRASTSSSSVTRSPTTSSATRTPSRSPSTTWPPRGRRGEGPPAASWSATCLDELPREPRGDSAQRGTSRASRAQCIKLEVVVPGSVPSRPSSGGDPGHGASRAHPAVGARHGGYRVQAKSADAASPPRRRQGARGGRLLRHRLGGVPTRWPARSPTRSTCDHRIGAGPTPTARCWSSTTCSASGTRSRPSSSGATPTCAASPPRPSGLRLRRAQRDYPSDEESYHTTADLVVPSTPGDATA